MDLTRRHMLTMTAGAMLASALPAFGSETFLVSGRAFGTTWRARLRGKVDAAAVAGDLADVLERIDLAMSPFRDDSEITQFNRAGAGWHGAGPDFALVTGEALRIAALTGGAFDPSVGPDVGRYGFGPIHGERAGGFDRFDVSGGDLFKADARLTLDLCGIAKGHALDLMAGRIGAAGVDNFVVEVGGEVLTGGTDIGGAPWQIGISDPLGGPLHAVVDTKGLAIATSGDAINAYTMGGRRYSHIIDPATDEPVVNTVASVSVLARSAMTADALATALMVMGARRGAEFAEAFGIPALFLNRTSGGLGETATTFYENHRLS